MTGPRKHYFFVNRIVEQVVGTVGSESCSYHVMLDCFITRLFGRLHKFVVECWGNPQYFVGDEDLTRLAAGLRYRRYLAGTFEWLWRCEAAGLSATITICLKNGGFLLHKVSIQTCQATGSLYRVLLLCLRLIAQMLCCLLQLMGILK